MPDLVTVSEAKANLRIFHDDFDDEIGMFISAASEAIINHMGARAEFVLDLDSGGEISVGSVVPAVVKAATIYLVGALHRGEADEFERGYLPNPVTAMLYPLRDPALS